MVPSAARRSLPSRPGRFPPVALTTDRNLNAYAVRGDDGRLRIAVAQKDDPSAGPVRLDLAAGGAALITLDC